MIIALTHDNGNIFGHFGHTQEFKIYEISEKRIEKATVINTMGSGHGALAELLSTLRVNVLICGGIGPGAKNALGRAKIEVFGGCSGNCDEAVDQYLKGMLSFDPDAECTSHIHHDKESGCSGHDCTSHNCTGSCH